MRSARLFLSKATLARRVPQCSQEYAARVPGGSRNESFSYSDRCAGAQLGHSLLHTGITRRSQQGTIVHLALLNSSSLSPLITLRSISIKSNSGSTSKSKVKNITESQSSLLSKSLTDNNDTAHTEDDAKDTSTNIPSTTSDPSMVSWVDDYLPASVRPYAHLSRMDKPIGTWLLLWPCYWSTAMAAGMEATTTKSLVEVLPDPQLLGLFTVGAFVMRGAGCTINDMWDRDLDKAVTRTKSRPLAAGILTPTQAVGWLAVQLSTGLGVLLSLPHTEYCFWWGAASLPIVVAYPAMKRIFDYPQLVLGLCFNWGAFMGWAACHGSMDYSVVLPLYASGVFWTIGYDTLYAHQDKQDDAKLGLKSTAITFGRTDDNNNDSSDDRSKLVLQKFAAATYASWLLAGYNDLAVPHAFGVYAMGVTGAYAHLVWQIRTANLSDPHNLAERFRSNAKVGGIVFGSIVAGKLALLC